MGEKLCFMKNLFRYGAEIITHHESEAYETFYDSCVVVHLADVNEVSIA